MIMRFVMAIRIWFESRMWFDSASWPERHVSRRIQSFRVMRPRLYRKLVAVAAFCFGATIFVTAALFLHWVLLAALAPALVICILRLITRKK
jgi:hypothetical protein